MIFGFLSRNPRAPRQDLDNIDADRDTPQALPPPPSPSPSPSTPPQVTESSALYSLIRSVPPQIFHTYSLDKLNPNNNQSQNDVDHPPPPPSPTVLTALTSFFSTLVPPPRLHCVRCHKSYFEVENSDRSCLVPHDDDSAEVERVPLSRTKGLGSEHETHWGCCGRTVEGDGDMGPPDGWCYEGKHTTDVKRARFRADATLNDDKLTPCSRLRCPGTSGQLLSPSPSSAPSHTARSGKKRARPVEDDTEVEDPVSQTDAEKDARSSPKRRRRTKSTTSRRKSGASAVEVKEEKAEQKLDVMEVDDSPQASGSASPSRPKPRRVRKSKSTVKDGNESAASSPPSAKARPQPRSRKTKSSSSTSTPAANTTTAPSTKDLASSPMFMTRKLQAEPPSSPSMKLKSISSSVHFKNTTPTPIPIPGNTRLYNEPYKSSSAAASLSDLSSIKSLSPSGARTVQRAAYVEVPKLSFTKSSASLRNPKAADKGEDTDRETDKEDAKIKCPGPKGRSARLKAKALSEVVDTSVDAERA